MVVIEYLCAMEGLFWKKIRGLGLSYGYGISNSIEEGLLYFTLARSTNVTKAYQVAKEIVDEFLAKKLVFDETTLEGARSSVIFAIVSREESIESAAEQAFLNYLKEVGPEANRQLLAKVQAVTIDDLHRVLEKYIKLLFDHQRTNLAVALNPLKQEETVKFFSEIGKKVHGTSLDDLKEF